jgi:tRNA nucleotidyltransferase (CCA-adding enzyme)
VQIVVGHANPDFDAYASTVAATRLFPGARGVYLGTQNANVRAFHNLHQEFLDFVDLKGLDLSLIDHLVMVDTRDPGRIGELGAHALDPDVELVVYDHHPPTPGDIARGEDRSLEVGATTSILVHELHRRGIVLTPLEATLFLLGIHEDTGSLTYPGSTAYDAEAAALLMNSGADIEVLNQFLSRQLSLEQETLLAQLTDTLEVWDVNGQGVAVGVAEAEEYVDSASVLTHYIVEDMGYRVAVAIVRMGERVQVVARSRMHEVDVGTVMERMGGGGHAQAASAAFKNRGVRDVLELLKDALQAEVRSPLRAHDIASAPVRTISPNTTMQEAGELMARWGHGGLPVLDSGVLDGMVTRKDVDKALRHDLGHAPVRGFMARDVITVAPDADLPELERLLAEEGIGRIPIVEADEIVGIVTRKDLLRAEHGSGYLDRRGPRVREDSRTLLLQSIDSQLPTDVINTLHELGRTAEDAGLRAHVVGGFVRDMLLKRRNLDIDIVVEGDGIEFAQHAAAALQGRVKVHRRFGTAVLVLSKTFHVDVTSARSEYYTRPGALPTVERSSLRQDLFRRDFSINAMAACINPDCFGAVADPFGGLRDLGRGTLRVLHSLSFVEDPTRVLRAARFEKRYGFTMDRSSSDLCSRAVEMNMLDEVSGARIREEILDIIDEQDPSEILARLEELGALEQVLPDDSDRDFAIAAVRASTSEYQEMASLFARTPRLRVTLIAALCAGATGSDCERWLKRMRFGREYGEPAQSVSGHGPKLLRQLSDGRGMRDSRLNRLLTTVPEEALIVLCSIASGVARTRIERYVNVVSHIEPTVNGDDLVALGLEPSQLFSAILGQALDARLDGRAVGREAELANLRRLASRRISHN